MGRSQWRRGIRVPDELQDEFASSTEQELEALVSVVDQAIRGNIPESTTVKGVHHHGWSVPAADWFVHRAYAIGSGFWPHASSESFFHHLDSQASTNRRHENSETSDSAQRAVKLSAGTQPTGDAKSVQPPRQRDSEQDESTKSSNRTSLAVRVVASILMILIFGDIVKVSLSPDITAKSDDNRTTSHIADATAPSANTAGSPAIGTSGHKLILWRLGSVDSRFGLSSEIARSDVQTAIDLWEQAVGTKLFAEDDSLGFAIDWIYDKRQRALEQIETDRKRVNASKNAVTAQRENLSAEKARLDVLQEDYNQRLSSLNDRTAAYNRHVEAWNALGGAPDLEKSQLDAESEEIRRSQSDLSELIDRLGELQESYTRNLAAFNSVVTSHNGLVGLANRESSLYDETVGECSQDKYTVNYIHIYAFTGQNDLVRTLAHELGHALGIKHVDQIGSVMNAVSNSDSGPARLSNSDVDALKRILNN